MRLGTLAKRLGLGLLALATVTQAAWAQEVDPLSKRVDLMLRNADLQSAVQALTIQTGIQFIIEPGEQEFKLIDVQLSQRTAEEAIRYVCQAAGAWAEKDENGVFIIRAGKPSVKPVAEKTPTLVERPMLVSRVRLMKADPGLVWNILSGQNVYNYNSNFADMREFSNSGSSSLTGQGTSVPTIINYGQPIQQTFLPQTAAQKSGGASPLSTVEAGEGIQIPGDSSKQLGGAGGQLGGGGGQLGGGGGQNGGGGATQLQGGQGLVPQGIQRVIFDPTDNSFIVQGTEEAIREFERLVEQFDVQPKQVVIKVEFVATTNTSENALGIDWLYQRGTIFAGVRPGEFARSGDPVFFNYATGNISSRLRTLMTNGWGRTVTAPLVRTLNNQPATVFQSITTYIFLPTINNGPSGQQTFFTPVPLTITTQLQVKPRINNNGTITMFLQPSLGSITGESTGPDGQRIPNFTQQQLQVATIVKDGETIALAGFTTKNDVYTVKRIPVLSDIPIIGQLFRGRNSQKSSGELIVFVTPNVVEADEFGLEP
ncbi:MAG: hypothetical protein KIT11_11035 [Fimbriimonadaceae bacterium]|nr:hypothetical protein [Fimbriimonadaceae bacterium]QYK55855.1 MAG: hypothetical protein KF733_12705 [Fimbriimonadaceae bacterium]